MERRASVATAAESCWKPASCPSAQLPVLRNPLGPLLLSSAAVIPDLLFFFVIESK